MKHGLTSREEHTLRVFKNSVLRKIFGPKKDEVKGECRRLHNKEVYDIYSSPNNRVIKSRNVRWVRHVAHMENSGGTHKVLVGRTEGKTSFGRYRHRWEDSIKVDLQEVGWGAIDWIDLA